MNKTKLIALAAAIAATPLLAAPQRLSDDRDLKELDLNAWNCLSKIDGTARTPDGQERNRLKNRSAPASLPANIQKFDVPGFLKFVNEFDSRTQNVKRKDMNPQQKEPLPGLENQIVEVTGYLGFAYAGPPETTNCASVDYHDWHLEVFENPPQHPPQPGDPNPIICEITPRTQNAIFKAGIRIQELTGFFRTSDLLCQPTGHPARKIRLTGYLMWDDEHNGYADVGTAVRTAPEHSFHNPWRRSAWELHPVFKIEVADGPAPAASTLGAATAPAASAAPAAGGAPAAPAPLASTPPNDSAPPTPEPTLSPTPTVTATPQQIVTLTQPVKIKILYGETVIPRGARLQVIAHDAQNVSVNYMGQTQLIPIAATDYH